MKTFLTLMMMTWVAAVSAETGPAAVLLRYRGDVLHRDKSSDAWTSVTQSNLTLQVGSELQTKENAEAILKLGAANIVTVRELSFLRLTSISDDDTAISLDAGRLFLNIRKKTDKTSFKVTTPAAVAGVRGTVFATETDAQKATRVTVTDGRVDVTGQAAGSRTVAVEKGQTVLIVFNEPPQDPRPAEMKQLEEMKTLRQDMESFTMIGGGAATQIAEENLQQLQDAGKAIEAQRQQHLGAQKSRVDMPALKAAFARCIADTGYVPSLDDRKFDEETSQLVRMLVEGKKADGGAIAGWKGPYMEGNLKDPFGRFYKLRYKENAKGEGRFEIFSLGQDPVKTDDDPVPTMIRLDNLTGPDGQPPAKPAR